jgi:hypothetical protein
MGNPEDLILVDREKAADMKLSVSEIANTFRRFYPERARGVSARAGTSTASWSKSKTPRRAISGICWTSR